MEKGYCSWDTGTGIKEEGSGPMKVLVIDPVGGVSGDMLLAGLIHLGCPAAFLEEVYAGLDLGTYALHVSRDSISGISCLHVKFDTPRPIMDAPMRRYATTSWRGCPER